MKVLYAAIAVILLACCGWVVNGAPAIEVPYTAAALLLLGIILRVIRWARVPVPFRIPTTVGQQRSLAWIRPSWLTNPFTGWSAAARVACEVLFFQSLFRNSKAEVHEKRFVFGDSKALWLGAMAFHWSLLVVLLRHARLLIEPVPAWVLAIQHADGFFQIGVPELYLSDVILATALCYLLLRRLRNAQVHYVSLFTDYFALMLLIAIGVSGLLMRHFAKVNTVAVKQFALGLASLHPKAAALPPLFCVHLVLVSTLAAYIPFSKLMHMGGVFLSPTRNLANNNRAVRHVNPWNYSVKTHTYAEWEDEFRDKIKQAGLPLEHEHAQAAGTD